MERRRLVRCFVECFAGNDLHVDLVNEKGEVVATSETHATGDVQLHEPNAARGVYSLRFSGFGNGTEILVRTAQQLSKEWRILQIASIDTTPLQQSGILGQGRGALSFPRARERGCGIFGGRRVDFISDHVTRRFNILSAG
jgi:hypothetical protein